MRLAKEQRLISQIHTEVKEEIQMHVHKLQTRKKCRDASLHRFRVCNYQM